MANQSLYHFLTENEEKLIPGTDLPIVLPCTVSSYFAMKDLGISLKMQSVSMLTLWPSEFCLALLWRANSNKPWKSRTNNTFHQQFQQQPQQCSINNSESGGSQMFCMKFLAGRFLRKKPKKSLVPSESSSVDVFKFWVVHNNVCYIPCILPYFTLFINH